MRRISRGAVAAGVAVVATAAVGTLAPRVAHAWCRTTTTEGFRPTDLRPCDDKGLPLYWSSKCVGFNVQRNASAQIDLTTARTLAQQAFDEWQKVDCPTDPVQCRGAGAGHPSISARDLGPASCDRVEYNKTSGNANLIIFRDHDWPHADSDQTLALTTVTFSPESGEIYDADMEVNSDPKLNRLTIGDDNPVYDFSSIMSHEAGHFFGLAHTQLANGKATMYYQYKKGQTFMRHPALDDVCGICAAYPPNRRTVCDPIPRRGLALECGAAAKSPNGTDAKKGCAVAALGPTTANEQAGGLGGVALGGGALALALGVARRRRRGAPNESPR